MNTDMRREVKRSTKRNPQIAQMNAEESTDCADERRFENASLTLFDIICVYLRSSVDAFL